MRAIDGSSGQLAAAGNSAQFSIFGGTYELGAVSATWGLGGTLAIQHLLPDGQTWFTDTTIKLTANGVIQGPLSIGTYQINLSGTPTSPIAWALSRVPLE